MGLRDGWKGLVSISHNMHHRLLWITDLHLEFSQSKRPYEWLPRSIKRAEASALLLTGDIMPGFRLSSALVKLVERAGGAGLFLSREPRLLYRVDHENGGGRGPGL